MANTFVLPEGLSLELSDDSLSIVYDGDVVLDTTLGRTLEEVRAGGDLTVGLPTTTGTLSADGVLTITGDVDATGLHGREVHVIGTKIKAKTITATERVFVGPGKLTVDVIMAPEVNLDAGATGRVTIVESHNERGPSKIKGGLSVADYEEMIGDANDFLADRGLEPLGEAGDLPPPSGPNEAATESEGDTHVDLKPQKKPTNRVAAPVMPVGEDEEEDDGDPLSLSIEDLEFVENDDVLHPKLSEALARILSCYEGDELPPAVEQLQTLVDARDYTALRGSITEVWNGLLGYHQKRGIRPHHQVTHAFNVIHGLVQDGM